MSPSVYPEDVNQAIEYLKKRVSAPPEIALILGSGLGDLADTVDNPIVISTSSIPNYPLSTVTGHQGRLIVGELGSKKVVVVQGRVHMYEGYGPDDVVFPVRLVRAMGAKNLIVTNAAGGISDGLSPGSLMWITDHIDWTWGRRPATHEPGVRDPSVRESTADAESSEFRRELDDVRSRIRPHTSYYNTEWMSLVSKKALAAGIRTSEGTYLWVRGPSYETAAEIRAFKRLGADTVGMSTVPEVIEACRLGMSVAGLSTVTNYAAGISDETLDHKEVLEVGKRVQSDLEALVNLLIQYAPQTQAHSEANSEAQP